MIITFSRFHSSHRKVAETWPQTPQQGRQPIFYNQSHLSGCICKQSDKWTDDNNHRLLIVYFHCIGIQRLYIRLWWYGKIISLNPTTTGVEPSERSWRSKEHIFISMRTLIHRVFSRKSGYYTRLQKSGICIFILCALSATRNCVFSCQKEKKNWDDECDMMG